MREKEETMFRDIDLQVAETIEQERTRKASELRLEHQALTHSRGPTRRGPSIAPGKEEDFRCFQSWLAVSDRLDRLIEATEPSGKREQVPAPATTFATSEQPAEAPTGKPSVVGGLAQRAGGALRRMGEGLERWGRAVPPREIDPA